MVIIKDNFLDEELFNWLSTLAYNKCEEVYHMALTSSNKNAKFYTKSQSAWDISYPNLDGQKVIPCKVLGVEFEEVYNKVVSELINNDIDVLPLDVVSFLFAKTGYYIPKHFDVRFLNTSTNAFKTNAKAFIFCHNVWEDNWGGELCFDSGEYIPKPNRLLIYTVDEEHWVNKVQDIYNNRRIIFGIRFGNEL